MEKIYDILILGGGPGGYVAAIRAAQLGFKVALVEALHLGGICLNWGCIPTKSLLRSAEIYHFLQHASEYGLKIEGTVRGEAEQIFSRSRRISHQLTQGVEFLLRKNKVEVVWGRGKLQAKKNVGGKEIIEIEVQKPEFSENEKVPPFKTDNGAGIYQAKHVLIATGARPRILPDLSPDGQNIWTYFEALAPKAFPKSLLIVGSGAIGVEFASFYRSFGVEVTLLELLPQILPSEDPEIAALARKRFEKAGIKILTQTKIRKVIKKADSIQLRIEEKEGSMREISAEKLLSAAGVVANTEDLGLEALNVEQRNGYIAVHNRGHTNVAGIYAIGDVCGPPLLAHKASHEAILCIESIKGLEGTALERLKIPGCIYAHPEIASVGLQEGQARAAGYDIRIGRFPFSANGKALALGESEGLIKTIFDKKTGKLLGAHLCGAGVTELIHSFVLAMNLETTEEEILQSIFPHPTLSEMIPESVLQAYERPLHII